MKARGLDHLVLPVATLATARERFGALGFTVAPQGTHPFGTINACIYFANATFVELLAVADPVATAAAIAEGNSFVGGDRKFRAAHGEEGFSAIVLASNDAAADHQRFARQGISGGTMVEFSRPFVDRDGNADIAAFLLAFAAPQQPSDSYFFTCERRKVARVDRAALERHENGVTHIVAVEAEAANPNHFAAFLAEMAGGEIAVGDHYVEVQLANAVIRISENRSALSARLSGIVFGVRAIKNAAKLFNAGSIGYQTRNRTLRVPPATGQGTWLIFEEAS